ncbi:hypothetical protein [Paenibacillus ginsengihumi]|uniref:hypothetical protein n=1 Tax=Paenibacillus ginsengihumi TaxID=431596 RepID=UPI00037FCFA6|nr:hypothetical protein [Paenibacillus ginsengihumi]
MVHIQFQHVQIDQLKDASAVFSGDNLQRNFSSIVRKSEGNGSVIGDSNVIIGNAHTVRNYREPLKAE